MNARVPLFCRLIALLCVSVALSACGPNSADIAAWETEQGGPEELAAVVTNERVKDPLRRDAALALTRAERRGRHVGLDLLLDALSRVQEPSRARIIEGVAPALVVAMSAKRPATGADPTLAAKDAAYAILARGLLTDTKQKDALSAALFAWISEDTFARLFDQKQRYGGRQLMTLLGARGVRLLPPLLDAQVGAFDLGKLCDLIVDLGDDATKGAAVDALIASYNHLASPEGLAALRAEVTHSDASSGMKPTNAQLDAQTQKYQENKLVSVLSALSRMAGVTGFLVDVASDERRSTNVRTAALSALRGREPTLTEPSGRAQSLFALVKKPGTPDAVLDAAFGVLRELSKTWGDFEAANGELEKSKDWRARLVGKSLTLSHLTSARLDEFMRALPDKEPMGLAEIFAYASELKSMFGSERLRPYLTSPRLGARLVALAAFADDDKTLAPFEADNATLSTCATCSLRCIDSVDLSSLSATSGVADGNDERTVGDFVRDCLEPPRRHNHGHEIQSPNTLSEELLKALQSAPPAP